MRPNVVLSSARVALLAALLALGNTLPTAAQEAHLLVVVGIGGDPEYSARFLEWGTTLRTAAIERYGLPPERAVLLAEDPTMAEGITGPSRRDDVEAALHDLAQRVGPEDRLMLVLIGHGSFRGDEANFNLPGPDLPASELGLLLDALPTSRIAVVNTASASGPYIEALAAPGRIVITATASGGERNETQFGGFFVAAWSGDDADLDKNGSVSLLEAFQYADSETERYYEERNLLPTEHAMLDDDGNGQGSQIPGTDDGMLAAGFTLGLPGARSVVATASGPIPTSADSVLTRMYQERAQLEGRVADLRRRSSSMEPEAYQRELEDLLIELALKSREIRAREGGE